MCVHNIYHSSVLRFQHTESLWTKWRALHLYVGNGIYTVHCQRHICQSWYVSLHYLICLNLKLSLGTGSDVFFKGILWSESNVHRYLSPLIFSEIYDNEVGSNVERCLSLKGLKLRVLHKVIPVLGSKDLH